MTDRIPTVSPSWLRAVQLATTSLDLSESVTGLLAEAASSGGARAGVVIEGGNPVARAAWGCEPSELSALLAPGGAIGRAMLRQDEWSDRVLPLSRTAAEPEWANGYEHLLLVPLRARGLTSGAVALLYDGARAPSPDDCDQATVFAGFLALVLENDRLYEDARAAQQARDHFLTALNHEMRTPATAFILTADLIRSAVANLPPRVDRLLLDAESQVTLLVEVLRRVLDLGSLGARVAQERSDIVQPRQVVADLMRRLEPTTKRKNLALALYTPRDLPPLQTDSSRFTRILMHLLSNAIKYTAEGRVEVRLERTSHRLGRGRSEPVLAIRVKDTGRGIPPEELQRIFEPFTQVDEGARTDSRSRGIGLGLPLAQQLARTLGGDVTLESSPGVGTTASLILPYHQQAAGA
ncbi:MAG: HAMP domain-containing histidine kinase [Gemmatimonadetes bacterium]|nr:HAMP domain-containing histidine kinase [Gemmatimonadota bacterium]